MQQLTKATCNKLMAKLKNRHLALLVAALVGPGVCSAALLQDATHSVTHFQSDVIIHDICDVVVTAPDTAEFALSAAKNGAKVGDLVVKSTCSLPVGLNFDAHESNVLSAVKEDDSTKAIGLRVDSDGAYSTATHEGGTHTTSSVTAGTQVTFPIYLTNTGKGEATETGRYIYGGTVGYWAN